MKMTRILQFPKAIIHSLLIAAACIALLSSTHSVNAQGCVAIRHSGFCTLLPTGSQSSDLGFDVVDFDGKRSGWMVGLSYRYSKADRHFRGSHEEKNRQLNNTEVINKTHFINLGLSYFVNERLSINFVLPYADNDRSSLYEHGRNERRTTTSRGIGDVRINANYWLFDFHKSPKQNIMLGLGFKLPTGDYKAQDTFYNVGPDGTPEVRNVDQSIQLGDGGYGLTFDLQAFKQVFNNTVVFVNGFYLVNPRETNGVGTNRRNEFEQIMSVTDQYFARAGFLYSTPFFSGFSLMAASRIEGIPVRDLVGGSLGFRRPGYTISAEPGVNYVKGKHMFEFSFPIAFYRNRTQSVPDKMTEQKTGNSRHGDASFADNLLLLGYAYRF